MIMQNQNELYHPAANLFPMMDEEQYSALKADIKENGLIEAIWFCEGKILDGRNRWRACNELNISPDVKEYTGNDPIGFVVSLNLKRRHLNSSQRAIVALEVERLLAVQAKERQRVYYGNQYEPAPVQIIAQVQEEPPAKSRDAAAAIVGTNRQYVSDAKRIEATAPELIAEIAAGNLSIPEAKKEIKKRERADYIQSQKDEIEAGNVAQPTGLYDVISLDPPWPYGREYDPDGSRVANPYPEMSIPEIKAIELPAKDSAVIFLWTTHKFLPDAFSILEKYGAAYKATLVWDKELIGMGAWFRMQVEFCLVGIIGTPVWDNTTERDIIRETRRQHSRKPDAFYSLVEKITTGRRLDYFSREQRPGWDNYGNEPTKF